MYFNKNIKSIQHIIYSKFIECKNKQIELNIYNIYKIMNNLH